MRRGGQVSGLVSLVLIFCVLCLCVFTVLTYSAAERDRSLCALNARRTQDYYSADTAAVAWVAERSADGSLAEGGTDSAVFPVGENQSLMVEIRRQADTCQILRWETFYSGDWTTNDSIIVWDGD